LAHYASSKGNSLLTLDFSGQIPRLFLCLPNVVVSGDQVTRTYFLEELMKTLAVSAALLFMGFGGMAFSAENNPKLAAKSNALVEPVLKANPKILGLLKNLKPGSSVFLPKFKVLGEFNDVARKHKLDSNGPGKRNWCNKMLWMPERKRAFYCGANHGSPHRLNDAWEYDLAANTWVMLYAPDLSKDSKSASWNDAIVKDGIPQTKRGGPVMVGHVWWALTYDPIEKKAFFFSYWPYQPKEWRPKLWKQYQLPVHFPMWAFDPAERKWIPKPNPTRLPNKGRAATSAVLEYIPERKSMFFKVKSHTSLYDASTNAYTDIKAQGGLPAEEAVYVYDTKNKILVAHLGGYKYFKHPPTTWHFDFKTSIWEKIAQSAKLPNGHDGMSAFVYDPASQRCFLYNAAYQNLPADPHIWTYRVKTKKWTKQKITGQLPSAGPMGYFDLEHNVFVIHSGRFGKSRFWVHRPPSPAQEDK
jgi:hypothetical protein